MSCQNMLVRKVSSQWASHHFIQNFCLKNYCTWYLVLQGTWRFSIFFSVFLKVNTKSFIWFYFYFISLSVAKTWQLQAAVCHILQYISGEKKSFKYFDQSSGQEVWSRDSWGPWYLSRYPWGQNHFHNNNEMLTVFCSFSFCRTYTVTFSSGYMMCQIECRNRHENLAHFYKAQH